MLICIRNWVSGAVFALLGILGLFLAAKGHSTESYAFGLTLSLIALVAIGMMVHAIIHHK